MTILFDVRIGSEKLFI